jgi:hypothetical protein
LWDSATSPSFPAQNTIGVMSYYGGFCKTKAHWNAIPIVAQIFLRTKLFTSRLDSTSIGSRHEWNLVSIYLDLYCQLQMREPHLRVHHLIHHFLKDQPAQDSGDLFNHLHELLFELDAPFNTENSFVGVFMGLNKGNKHPFVRPESVPSIQGGFDAFRRARPAFRPGRGIFFDVRPIRCDQQPRLSPGGWELFVVVSEPNICQYELFLRDPVGWLSIAGERL